MTKWDLCDLCSGMVVELLVWLPDELIWVIQKLLMSWDLTQRQFCSWICLVNKRRQSRIARQTSSRDINLSYHCVEMRSLSECATLKLIGYKNSKRPQLDSLLLELLEEPGPEATVGTEKPDSMAKVWKSFIYDSEKFLLARV